MKDTLYSLLFSTFFLLISKINSYYIIRAFQLLSDDILLITNEGIIKNNPNSTSILIYKFTSFNIEYSDCEYISFNQFPLEEGGYIILKILKYILILSNNATYINITTIDEEIQSIYTEIIPYLDKNNNYNIFSINLEDNYFMSIFQYKIDFKNNTIDDKKIFLFGNFHDSQIYFDGISCELMFW